MQGGSQRNLNPRGWTVIEGGKDELILQLTMELVRHVRDDAVVCRHDAAMERLDQRSQLTVIKGGITVPSRMES